ncbi:MAG: ATP-binding protein [Acidovorax sp.]|uniref:ATP-binding protein n=1 Tax=Acidovorax sp. TaxID=1872122 RepID=UPI0039E295E7
MQRYLDARVAADLKKKLVFVTGPRQVGKTTLSRLLMQGIPAQYLNYDVAADRAIIEQQSWRLDAQLLVLDEIHKMPQWKNWLKGVIDGKPAAQQLLVTGSARMDTFRQTGDSLAGRFHALRLHPLSVREWCTLAPTEAPPTPEEALTRLLERGGFPEPMLDPDPIEADRWRRQYIDGLVREDVLEFSRIQELGAMRLFVDMLRERVGSPLSLASMARDLNLAQPTLRRYLDILQALFIVFAVPPWHRNIARAVLQQPKVYFYDTGLVRGGGAEGDGARFENLVACHLLKHAQWQQDALGRDCQLHYLRTKDGAEVDFALSDGEQLTHLVECKWADAAPHRALARFAGEFPQARAVQAVRHLRQPEQRGAIAITHAAQWLAELSA